MKVLIAPDKFKGSLSASDVATVIAEGLQANDAIGISIQPMADGGEGSLELIDQNAKVERSICTVSDPLFRPIQSSYLMTGDVAYIEMSLASGMNLLADTELDCMHTSSYGTGQLIIDAIENGAREINLFIGGSATTDLGIGMASAIGYRFLNTQGLEVLPIGKNMGLVRQIERSSLLDQLMGIRFNVITDVDNPLYGHYGASYMYGAQKGATNADLLHLDNGLRSLSDVISRDLNNDVSMCPGAGAAGGLGGGAMAFLKANPISGISFFVDLFDLEEQIEEADLVITGEGSLDQQSLHGKVIAGVLELCRSKNKPCIIICGRNDLTADDLFDIEVHDILSIADNQEDAMVHVKKYLLQIAQSLQVLDR